MIPALQVAFKLGRPSEAIERTLITEAQFVNMSYLFPNSVEARGRERAERTRDAVGDRLPATLAIGGVAGYRPDVAAWAIGPSMGALSESDFLSSVTVQSSRAPSPPLL